MKKVIIILTALFTSLSSFAQDPQLLENDWYLQKIIIDDVEYIPPINVEVDNVFLSFFPDYNFFTTVCEALSSYSITITNDFFTVDTFIILPDGSCILNETVIFENIYYNEFFNWQETNNNFYYNIVEGASDFKTLTLTNDVNYLAIYGSEILSNPDFDNLSFSFLPNPVKDILQIQGQNIGSIENIKVYDISGKLVIEENKNVNQLDVSNLSSGIFFLKLKTEKGVLTKKIIKE